MIKFPRVFVIVCDSLGVGASEDAYKYDDVGSNTLDSLSNVLPDIKIPTLEKLGLGMLGEFKNIKKAKIPEAFVTKMSEASNGKDTLTGHWELMGLKTTKPFKTFTNEGFPNELLDEITKKTGYPIIGNIASNGVAIINDLGEEHLKTGALIIYTSSDSVLQIAAHEEKVGLDKLYEICQIVREITLEEKWLVGRIIARPFIGDRSGHFTRTPNRKDYAVSPPSSTLLDLLKTNGNDVIAVGKISDIFNGHGITKSIKTKNNEDGMDQTIALAKENFNGLCFVNLVDFDMEYGHPRDPIGYAKCLERFDLRLDELIKLLRENDLLIVTADHGNDPSFKGNDHTREKVPLIMYSKSFLENRQVEECQNFSTLAKTIATNFNLENDFLGTDLFTLLK